MYLAQFHDVRHVESLLYMYIHMITHVYVTSFFHLFPIVVFQKNIS